MKSLIATLLLLILPLGALSAAPLGGDEDDEKKPPARTASSLRAEVLYQGALPATATARRSSSRIIPLAFGLSAAVPGLGQAYNRQWVKAGVALAAEAALIVGYTTWRQRGIDGRDAYQVYAHEYWSPLRYAFWLNDYKTWLEVEKGTPIPADFIRFDSALDGVDFTNPDGWTSTQQAAVRALIDQIRALESEVYHPETGASFSHKLPFFGEQQYYELVGKYFQFAPGWSDYQFVLDENGQPTWIDENGNFLNSIDPETTGAGGSKPNVSARFFEYADDHGTANDYLRRASRMSVFFMANHFLAAVDAAVFAKVHNDRLAARLDLTHDAFGNPEPGATLSFKF